MAQAHEVLITSNDFGQLKALKTAAAERANCWEESRNHSRYGRVAKENNSVSVIKKSAATPSHFHPDEQTPSAAVASSGTSIQPVSGMDRGPATPTRGAASNDLLSEDAHPRWESK